MALDFVVDKLNEGMQLGAGTTVEDIAANYEQIVDLTNVKPRDMLPLG